ncbi:MAG TPA: hypothetical protein PLD43_01295 [Anaerolineae bacterium]|nr:hypothetical protein [Anaerolineae bacterium]HXK42119.1 hypothetical protein [Anaerolineae bacterium]
MNELVRQKLRELVQQRQAIKAAKGHDPVLHGGTCRRQLEKLCGDGCLTEINVLTTAVRDQIPADIEAWPAGAPIAEHLERLTAQFMEHYALREDAARWAVEAWAEALGMAGAAPSLIPPPAPDPTPAGAAPSLFTPSPVTGAPLLFSTWRMTVLTRPRGGAHEEWVVKGESPPPFTPSPGEELGVRPEGLDYPQIGLWASSFRMPERIRYLDLSDRALFDPYLDCLTLFTGLMELNLERTDITGEGLSSLQDQPLTWLSLQACKNLSDKGLEAVGRLRNLQYLDLSDCNGITAQGLWHLRALTELRVLRLERCTLLQEETLAPLAAIPRLEELDLSETRISGVGFLHFHHNRVLRRLSLEGCRRVTSETVVHLLNLEALEVLHLGWTAMGDEALEHLKALPNLRKLDVSGCTRLTGDKLDELRRHGVRVFSGESPVILGGA